MRSAIYCILFLFTLTSCEKLNDDNVLESKNMISNTKDSIQYVMLLSVEDSFSNPAFNIQDTLDAFLTISNESNFTDTLNIPIDGTFYSHWSNDNNVLLPSCGLAYLGSWRLTNVYGRVVMYGPISTPQNTVKVPLRPGYTFESVIIHQAFKDSLGSYLQAGSYTLQENISGINLSVKISLR